MNECPTPRTPDYSGIKIINMEPENGLDNYTQAMAIANEQATKHIGEHMLLSWYDRDRDFESPQHASECSAEDVTSGYIHYGLHHGATLKVDLERGRFVFFYMPLDI
jgi:hypothetical protein